MYTLPFATLLLASVTAGLVPDTACPGTSSIVDDAPTFARSRFDYLILGGGTAGMVLAARLAEEPGVLVGVVEAGKFLIDDPVVNTPGLSGKALGNSTYDWSFVSTPQSSASMRNFSLPRGKMLGGSSGINLMAFNRASSPEYDAWKRFAPGSDWSWDGLLPFFAKSESIASLPQDPFPLFLEESFTGGVTARQVGSAEGPISGSFNTFYHETVPRFVQTLHGLGTRLNVDPSNGNATGLYNTRLSVNRTIGVRSYSSLGYLCGHPARSNLHILTEARATKILFSSKGSDHVATGAEVTVGSNTYTIGASKEVIVSAGTVQTPQILELSGIGNAKILSSNGVSPLIDLPGVGENLQEHLNVGVQWQLRPGIETFDELVNNATFEAEQQRLYDSNGTGLLAALDSTLAFLPLQSVVNESRISDLLAQFDEEAKTVDPSSLQAEQYKIQRAWIAEGAIAQSELIMWSRGFINPAPNSTNMLALGGISHPMSRGSVHISSNDPLASPVIDPQFLSKQYDSQVLLDLLKLLQKIGKSGPVSEIIDKQTSPDPASQDDESLLEYIRASCAGSNHLIGTSAMAPRSLGGVVDSNLKVYGTRNVRVVDASIIPLHIAAHMEATVYAIAEKAAAMILEGS
ncbi:hypothetical protein ACEPAH_4017 [Sanghuangporus vaninii]